MDEPVHEAVNRLGPPTMNPVALAASFAVGLVIAVGLFFFVATYNDVVALQRRIEKAWSNIDVILQQRHDQLPALVDAVRGMLAFERDVLTTVTVARAAYSPAAPIPAQAAVAAETTRAVRTLLATVERYPEVRSADNVLALQTEIERIEAMLADRRELYNDQVYRYNTRIAEFPGALLAGWFRWRPRPFFDAQSGSEQRSVDLGDAIEPPAER